MEHDERLGDERERMTQQEATALLSPTRRGERRKQPTYEHDATVALPSAACAAGSLALRRCDCQVRQLSEQRASGLFAAIASFENTIMWCTTLETCYYCIIL